MIDQISVGSCYAHAFTPPVRFSLFLGETLLLISEKVLTILSRLDRVVHDSTESQVLIHAFDR